ncbi:hypothetical protein INT45_004876 [Circinella minor]|uniref:Uncharacterized protein n=1 Tax=Circinella minor TaxID=1195481 RepID=A0A8H7V968_9FUNG|nr:hypothetical protein INT45_004875 [Circinella minor]KAG2214821.1 hypothetical protein INT45_004876 [Circinella minor]
MNPHQHFQQHRATEINPLTYDDIEVTTREELTFKKPPIKMAEGSTNKNTVIMQALTKLLAKQDSGPMFYPYIHEPDTYYGDRGLDAATDDWVRSIERYLEMANLGGEVYDRIII